MRTFADRTGRELAHNLSTRSLVVVGDFDGSYCGPESFLSLSAQTTLRGVLRIPHVSRGIVLFAHGSGSGRLSPRNTYVAERLSDEGLASLLFDLLTAEEGAVDSMTAELRFDIPLLTERLVAAAHWTKQHPKLADMMIGYFGASTGAAAALAAAARIPEIAAVVARGGRPDLAGSALADVRAPTLLIVGGNDPDVLALNRSALAQLNCAACRDCSFGNTLVCRARGLLVADRPARAAPGDQEAHPDSAAKRLIERLRARRVGCSSWLGVWRPRRTCFSTDAGNSARPIGVGLHEADEW